MADAFTSGYNFTLPEVGASPDTWGNKLNSNWSSLDSLLEMFVGMVVTFPATATLSGWLKCTGQAVSRTTHDRLWAFAQASGQLAATEGAKKPGQFGPGDGSTTFTLPDLRGEYLRYFDDGKGTDSGRDFGTLQVDQNKSHNHSGSTGSAGSHNHGGSTGSGGSHSHSASTGSAGGHSHSASTGGAGSHSHLLVDNRSFIDGLNNSNTINMRADLGTQDSYSLRASSDPPDIGRSSTDGFHSHSVTVNSVGGHTHSVSVGSVSNHTHTISSESNHSHTISSDGGGEVRVRNVALMPYIKT